MSGKDRIQIKRAYEPPAPADGYRVLVDRLWPRGVSKTDAKLDAWLKDVAPSDSLRKWFGHDPERWTEFAKRYGVELREPTAASAVRELAARARKGTVTLVHAARDKEHNNAVVLRRVLARRVK